MANIYWSTIQANFRLSNDADNLHFVLGRLLNTGRPRSALQICQDDFGRVDATIVAEILERVLHGEESEAPLPRSWYVGKALKHLRSSQIVNRQRLIRLEFGFFRALEYGAEYHADTLYEALMSDPALFVELLCILYKPHNGEKECPLTASEQTAAEIAWYVLRSCRRQPGTQPDGIIDPAAFVQFVDTARQLALKADRLEVCDSPPWGKFWLMRQPVQTVFGLVNQPEKFLTGLNLKECAAASKPARLISAASPVEHRAKVEIKNAIWPTITAAKGKPWLVPMSI